jgi:hypothetical protein
LGPNALNGRTGRLFTTSHSEMESYRGAGIQQSEQLVQPSSHAICILRLTLQLRVGKNYFRQIVSVRMCLIKPDSSFDSYDARVLCKNIRVLKTQRDDGLDKIDGLEICGVYYVRCVFFLSLLTRGRGYLLLVKKGTSLSISSARVGKTLFLRTMTHTRDFLIMT